MIRVYTTETYGTFWKRVEKLRIRLTLSEAAKNVDN